MAEYTKDTLILLSILESIIPEESILLCLRLLGPFLNKDGLHTPACHRKNLRPYFMQSTLNI